MKFSLRSWPERDPGVPASLCRSVFYSKALRVDGSRMQDLDPNLHFCKQETEVGELGGLCGFLPERQVRGGGGGGGEDVEREEPPFKASLTRWM